MKEKSTNKPVSKPSSLPPDRIQHSVDKPSSTNRPSKPVIPKK